MFQGITVGLSLWLIGRRCNSNVRQSVFMSFNHTSGDILSPADTLLRANSLTVITIADREELKINFNDCLFIHHFDLDSIDSRSLIT